MTIKDWIEQHGSYEQGIFLYSQLPYPNSNLLRFFNRGKTTRSVSRLKYELKKHKGSRVRQQAPKAIKISATPKVAEVSHEVLKQQSLEASNKKIVVAQLPPALRQVFYDKNKNFYTLYELKLQLNELPHDAEGEALSIIKQLMELRRKITAAWEQIDYYVANKREMPTASFDVASLSAMELVQARQRRYAQRTKRKNTLIKWEEELDKADGTHPRLEAKIAKQQDHLETLEQEIKLLTNTINEAT